MTSEKLTGKLARWALILQEYDFSIEHRAGTMHTNADMLSKSPLPTTEDLTGVRQDNDSPKLSVNMLEVAPWTPSCYLVHLLEREVTKITDIWEDENVLFRIRESRNPEGITIKERDKIGKRQQKYK